MDLLAQARMMEQEFEQKKAELRTLEIQQAMYKEQFTGQKSALAAKNITFNTGADLQAIYLERQQRLQALIDNRNQMMTQQMATLHPTAPTAAPSLSQLEPSLAPLEPLSPNLPPL